MWLYLHPFILSVLHLLFRSWSTRSLWKMRTTDLHICGDQAHWWNERYYWSSPTIQFQKWNCSFDWLNPRKECGSNVSSRSFRGALLGIPKDGCEGEYWTIASLVPTEPTFLSVSTKNTDSGHSQSRSPRITDFQLFCAFSEILNNNDRQRLQPYTITATGRTFGCG